MSKRGMMDQYMDIKKEHPDSVLFFRMGDFYEQFHDDAVVSSEVLGITLTSRDKKAEDPIPMAGFPWHALEDNLRQMLQAGHKYVSLSKKSNYEKVQSCSKEWLLEFTHQVLCMKEPDWN